MDFDRIEVDQSEDPRPTSTSAEGEIWTTISAIRQPGAGVDHTRRGYTSRMGIPIVVLVVLAIIALVIYIFGRGRR